MYFTPPLEQGTLLRRYKRFLADVKLSNGNNMTLHCPNTGSMRHCLYPGFTVWFSTSDNPKRKYRHTWELMSTPTGGLIGINPNRANTLAENAINQGVITELTGYNSVQREVKYGSENSRIDILLSGKGLPDCYVEIKSCTLLENHQGYFPDAVSVRAQKHLRELMHVVTQGYRAVLLFVVQHSEIFSVAPAEHIDPAYASLLKQAVAAGVEVLGYRCNMSPTQVQLTERCAIKL